MDYIAKIEECKSLKDLFQLHKELVDNGNKYSELCKKENSIMDTENAKLMREAYFYQEKINREILIHQNNGFTLSDLKKEETKEEVLQLLSKHIKNGNIKDVELISFLADLEKS